MPSSRDSPRPQNSWFLHSMSAPHSTTAIARLGIVVLVTAALSYLLCTTSCVDRQQGTAPEENDFRSGLPTTQHRFDIHWPLIDPETEDAAETRSLLTGQLQVTQGSSEVSDVSIVISLTLVRPETDAHRTYWNSSLHYREHQWMDRVRVWDVDQKWLYPNLPFLFKLHGVDRIDRYGGWDEGHSTDNDFGAVLIRCVDVAGQRSAIPATDEPLVSAAWYAEGVEDAERRTIAHRARSDEFTIHLPRKAPESSGRIKLWFVYGDFMEHPVPKNWPQEPELDGGTLAFFHIDWNLTPGRPVEFEISPRTPEPTGFDWRTWVGRSDEYEDPIGEARQEMALP